MSGSSKSADDILAMIVRVCRPPRHLLFPPQPITGHVSPIQVISFFLLCVTYSMAHVNVEDLRHFYLQLMLLISPAGLEPGQVQEPGKDLYWF